MNDQDQNSVSRTSQSEDLKAAVAAADAADFADALEVERVLFRYEPKSAQKGQASAR